MQFIVLFRLLNQRYALLRVFALSVSAECDYNAF